MCLGRVEIRVDPLGLVLVSAASGGTGTEAGYIVFG